MNELHNIHIDPDEAAAELCKRSFYDFVQEFWDVIIPEDPVFNWHIEYLCNEGQKLIHQLKNREAKKEDIIINIPPGTTKSTIWSVMLPCWAWVVDPTLRIMSMSYSDEVAMGLAVKSRNIIQSDKYRRYFDVELKRDQNNKTNYENTRNGQRYSSGIGGSITGMHFHLILIDDPLNPKEASSEIECANASKLIDNTLSTRKVDKKVTVTVLIMQRLSENDPTGHLLAKEGKKIKHICLPAELLDGVKPAALGKFYVDGLLDPIRLGPEVLAEARIDLGEAAFAGQFGQRPAPAGGLIWQRWFIVVPDHAWPDKKHFSALGTDWDLAYTKDDDNAASAWITAGKIGNNIYLDNFGWAWLEFPALIRYMKQQQSPHFIEAKASGKSAKQTLSEQNVIAIEVPVKGGADKIARARMSTPVAEAGHVYIKKSMAEKMYSDSKQGILNFPRGKFKDLADVLAQTLQRLGPKGSVTSHTGTERDDD